MNKKSIHINVNNTGIRALLFLPLVLYCVAVVLWILIDSKQEYAVQPILSDSYNNVENTEFPGEELLATTYNVNVYEALYPSGTHNQHIETGEPTFSEPFFTGQGGYDISVPFGSYETQIGETPDPKAWIKEIQSVSEYPDLIYTSYRIQEDDMIGMIAERFNITQDTLISVNNIRKTRLIQIGDYLRIPSMAGILYTPNSENETPESVAEKYDVSAEKMAAVNNLQKDTALTVGKVVFVPDAELDWVTRQEINGDLFSRPLRNHYYISSYFGWRNSPFTGSRSYHYGIDLAAQAWTPIYAALEGRVTTARRGDPIYGNYIIVTHHSGYTTLYAHMIDLNVPVGRYVSTDSLLGWVGSTGLSTGNHLHFGVYKYGQAINPIDLWN
ncbi:MAG: M23 family metallopeptidase [Spirochaetales bacterium]